MQLTTNDHRRRDIGLYLLVGGLAMSVWGSTVLQPHLDGLGYLMFWLICFSLLLLALSVAVLDMILVGRRLRAERRALDQAWEAEIQTLKQRMSESARKTPGSPPAPIAKEQLVHG